MKAVLRMILSCLALVALAGAAQAATAVSVRMDIGGAPPPPRIVFHAEPHQVYEPEQRVYVVDDPACGDTDCLHYGAFWYTFSAGYWYRSYSWRGPFAVVHPREVPEAFYSIPAARWKHRALRAEVRHEVRAERREDRHEARVDRHEDHHDDRAERRDERHDRRHDRREDRHERHGHGHGDRDDDKGEKGRR